MVGNRLSVQEIGGSYAYGYDRSYQLTHEERSGTNPYSVTYTYDGPGNRLTKVDGGATTVYSYDAANAQVLAVPPSGLPVTSTYDGNGNLVFDTTGSNVIAWDGENRFGVAGSTPFTMTYNANGMRHSKRDVTGTEYLLWDKQNILKRSTETPTNTAQHLTNYPGYWGG